MYKNIVHYVNSLGRRHAVAAVLGATVIVATLYVMHLHELDMNPMITGSACNQKMTAAVNGAYGTNASFDTIARSTRGNSHSADVSIWSDGWIWVHVEGCDRIQKDVQTN